MFVGKLEQQQACSSCSCIKPRANHSWASIDKNKSTEEQQQRPFFTIARSFTTTHLNEKLLPDVVLRRRRPDEEGRDVLGHLALGGGSSILVFDDL